MFHLRDGFYFERKPNGDVTITKRVNAQVDSPILRELTVTDSEWASVVASVSARGETSDSYREALDFHRRT